MDALDRLTELIAEQNRIAEELEQAANEAAREDARIENGKLRQEIERLTAELKTVRDDLHSRAAENNNLKSQLFDHMFNERARLLDNSHSRLEAYFHDNKNSEADRLTQLERQLYAKCDEYMDYLKKNRLDAESHLFADLSALKTYAQQEIGRIQAQAADAEKNLYFHKNDELRRLHDEPLSVEDAARHDKQNNMESFLGLKIINKLGLILIIFGVIALGQFTIARVPNEAKSALIFLLGLLMLAGGEFMNRKGANVFSLGLSSGGAAILYLAVTLSFFYLKIINAPAALVICVLVTIAAFILSMRYSAETIAVFALIGGYLAVVFVKQGGGQTGLVYYQLIYFILLGMFSFIIAFRRKWRVAQHIGFFLQIFAAAIGLFMTLPHNQTNAAAAVIYISLMFLIYSLIPLISAYMTDTGLDAYDNTLMALNIALGSGMLFIALVTYDRTSWASPALFALCVWHLFLWWSANAYLNAEITCRTIFYITAMAFAVLIVPVQFGYEYTSLGWLFEGAGLLVCGIAMKRQALKYAGFIISCMCLTAFVVYDLVNLQRGGMAFFIRYLCITLCSVIVAASYYYTDLTGSVEYPPYKTAVLVNIWIFLVYTVESRIPALVPHYGAAPQFKFFVHMAACAVTFIWAYIIAKVKHIADAYSQNASMVMSILGILFLLSINTSPNRRVLAAIPAPMAVFAVAVSVIVNLMSAVIFIDMVQRLTIKKVLTIEWYPVCAASFILLLATQNIYVMMDLPLTSMILTVLFASAALAFILFGFAKRFLYIRLAGLGLSFAVTFKFFLIDLSFLTSVMRIISYFGLGAALLAISFVYQHFDRELTKEINPEK